MTTRDTIIGCTLALLLFGAWYFHDKTQKENPGPSLNVAVLREEFATLIRSEGAEAAYQTFLREHDASSVAAHSVMHLFGETLYDVLGIDAVSACGPEIEYGCYHGFFLRALTTEGVSVVKKLDAACREENATSEQVTGCQHGLGHGAIEYVGTNNLEKALAICDQVQHSPLGGCYSGVFMQYNVPQSVAENGSLQSTARTPKDAKAPYDPCPTIGEAYQASCYDSLGQWWEKLYSPSYDRMGRLCDRVPDQEFRTTCFHSLATVIASGAGFKGKEIVRRCQMMPDEETKTLCLRFAAQSVQARAGDTLNANIVCAALGATTYACPAEVSVLSDS